MSSKRIETKAIFDDRQKLNIRECRAFWFSVFYFSVVRHFGISAISQWATCSKLALGCSGEQGIAMLRVANELQIRPTKGYPTQLCELCAIALKLIFTISNKFREKRRVVDGVDLLGGGSSPIVVDCPDYELQVITTSQQLTLIKRLNNVKKIVK